MTVLTIDFDTIMYLSLPTYNNFIREEYKFEDMATHFPHMWGAAADLGLYQNLTEFLMKLFERLDKDAFYFIDNHAEIVDCTADLEKFDLINVDYHHDIGYGYICQHWDEELDFASVGDWVKYLTDRDRINSYTWVANGNSEFDTDIIDAKYYPQEVLELPFDFYKLEKYLDKIDRVVLCGSSWWIPPMYRHLFATWKLMYDYHYKEVK